jgi:C-terminal processing protease CtpA/Prc
MTAGMRTRVGGGSIATAQTRGWGRWLAVSALLVLAIAVAQEAGSVPSSAELRQRNALEEILALPEGRALIEAYLAIRRDYLPGSNDAALLQGAIRGMVEALDDPYVQYLSPAEVAAEERISRGPAAVAAILFDDVGYLRIPAFTSERVGEEARTVVQVLLRRNVGALILDLRQNGGGLVRGGLQLLDLFIADAVLGYRSTRSGAAPLAFANPGAIELPLVVLIDGGTASTAEMVAGALQTYQRAQLYGMPSAGKGVGQTQIPLPDGGSLRLVTFRWSLPDRRSIDGVGLHPTVLIDGPAEAGPDGVVFGDPEVDPVLRRALRDLQLFRLESPKERGEVAATPERATE